MGRGEKTEVKEEKDSDINEQKKEVKTEKRRKERSPIKKNRKEK